MPVKLIDKLNFTLKISNRMLIVKCCYFVDLNLFILKKDISEQVQVSTGKV